MKSGFGSMDVARQRAIASQGGKAAHATGKAHEWTLEEARKNGRKGGAKLGANKEHMAAIGRAGGAKSAAVRAEKKRQKVAAEAKQPAPEAAE